jgi:hypothetical protein
VGYRVGDWPRTRYDTTGAIESWKVFFEFLDDARPSPAATDAFTQRLGQRGFRGDWKMNATSEDPDMPRFQYNNLIVHAWSPADAEIAEAVGLDLFRGHLAGHGRGLDVGTPPDARGARVVEIYDTEDFLRAREQSPDTLAGMLTVALAVRSADKCPEVAARLETRCE